MMVPLDKVVVDMKEGKSLATILAQLVQYTFFPREVYLYTNFFFKFNLSMLAMCTISS